MDNSENITLRKGARARAHSLSLSDIDDSVYHDQSLDGTSHSVPCISDDDTDLIITLKQQLKSLTMQLQGANDEIDKITLENSTLKKVNDSLMRENQLYKRICNSPVKSTKSTPKKKEERKQQKDQRAQSVNNIKLQQHNNQYIKTSSTNEAYQETDIHSKSTSGMSNTKQDCQGPKNKIHIISSNKTNNNILSLAKQYFGKKYNICHYLFPSVGINNLLMNISKKLENFTLDDFCNIIIGEHDFRASNNYIDLVTNLRNIGTTG